MLNFTNYGSGLALLRIHTTNRLINLTTNKEYHHDINITLHLYCTSEKKSHGNKIRQASYYHVTQHTPNKPRPDVKERPVYTHTFSQYLSNILN